MTGSMPGNAASTGDTWLFGSAPKPVAAPENSFDLAITWAWVSRPITRSHSPVRTSINAVMIYFYSRFTPASRRKPGPTVQTLVPLTNGSRLSPERRNRVAVDPLISLSLPGDEARAVREGGGGF